MALYQKPYKLVNQVISAVGNGASVLEEGEFNPNSVNALGAFLYNKYHSIFRNALFLRPWIFASKRFACTYVEPVPDFELDKGYIFRLETYNEELDKEYDVAYIHQLDFTEWYKKNYKSQTEAKKKFLYVRVFNAKEKTFVTQVTLYERPVSEWSNLIEAEAVIVPEIGDCPEYFTAFLEASLEAPLLQFLQGTADTNEYKLAEAKKNMAFENAINAHKLVDHREDIISAKGL